MREPVTAFAQGVEVQIQVYLYRDRDNTVYAAAFSQPALIVTALSIPAEVAGQEFITV